MPAVIVTGGFRHSNNAPLAVSTDVAALNGARRFAIDHGIDLRGIYEAWVPELDSRPDVGGAVRLDETDGITLRVMPGRTPLGRRLAMVAGVDLVVTISGKTHTEVVIEQALELGLPVFPIPDAGGDSRDMLEKHRARIASGFDPGALDLALQELSASIADHPEIAAIAAVRLIQTARVGRCLVLLPFDEHHKRLYESSIVPSVARHMFPLRLDDIPSSEAIYSSFADAVRLCSAVIADITQLNENVMYEVGYAHGCGLVPLIYTRDAARLEKLPVYFRTLNVHLAPDETRIKDLIDKYLSASKAARASHHHAV
jgi:hypothetical protein